MDTLSISIISLILSALSIAITVFIFYSRIDKKLRLLTENKENIISKPQAIELAQVYNHLIQEKLKFQTKLIIHERFSENTDIQMKDNHKDFMHRFVHEKTEKITTEVRNLFSSFKLIRGESFKDFAHKLTIRDKSNQKKAKDVILYEFNNCIENKICGEHLESRIIKLIETAGEVSHKEVVKKLNKMYKV